MIRNGGTIQIREENNVKNMRKDATLGIILLAAWLVIRVLFSGSGIFLWLLGAAGLILLVVGLLPDGLHRQVMDFAGKIRSKFKK